MDRGPQPRHAFIKAADLCLIRKIRHWRQSDLLVLAERKSLGLAGHHEGDVAVGTRANERPDNGCPKRSGATGDDYVPVLKVHGCGS
jgi:hypothetical protein